MRNTLVDLNNHLFEQIERVSDSDIRGEELDEEMKRAKAVSDIAKTVIMNGRLMLDANKYQSSDGYNSDRPVSRVLIGDTENE